MIRDILQTLFRKSTTASGVFTLMAGTASAGFFTGRLSADQFSILAVMAFTWAFANKRSE